MNSYGYGDLMSSMENFVEEHASLILTILGVSIILCVLMIISLWKIFTKSGEKGWKALIPFYNILTLMKIIDMSWWFIILMFIPFVQLFFYALLSVMLANRFGKGVIFAIGILFLPCIFIPILAFTKSELVEYEEDDDVVDDEEEDCIYCPNCNTKLGKDAKICFVCKTKIGKETKDEKEEEKKIKEEKEIVDTDEDIKEIKEEEKEAVETNNFDIKDELLDTKEDFKEENELDLDNILKEIDKETENLQEAMDTTLEDEKEDIDSTSKEEEKDEKTIDEILKVDKEEEPKYKEKKFKSSTKTLDDILKINQNLYETDNKEKKHNDDSTEDIEILDLEPEEIEKKPKKKESDIKLCPSCGSKVPSYSTYCIFCGEEVK